MSTTINMNSLILIKNSLVAVPESDLKIITTCNSDNRLIGTVMSNVIYYGYVPSKEVYLQLTKLTSAEIKSWWSEAEPILKKVTGTDKKMGEFVVYKNFPREVLEMSQAEYWIKQILMYIGLPNEIFTEEEEDRETLLEDLDLKVLHLANGKSFEKILSGLAGLPARWTSEQFSFVSYLVIQNDVQFDIASIPFKENLVQIVAKLVELERSVNMRSATDVLRLAVGMSEGDVSMKTNSKLRSFSRKERKFFLYMLENSTALTEDMARNKNRWKKFMRALRPNDYRSCFPNVCASYDGLYNNTISTFNSKVEKGCENMDPNVLELLQKRPGDFMRRLNQMIDMFGDDAIKKFYKVIPELNTIQLLKLAKYVENVNSRVYRTFAPKGNWTKLQVVENNTGIPKDIQRKLLSRLNREIKKNVSSIIPSVNLSKTAKLVKLQTNDSDLTNYGRGTVFPIPENVNFIRSASYWEEKQHHSVWFDNGWNFFDDNWRSKGACCWNSTDTRIGAVFSGDPTNTKDSKGRACQLIDLYLDKLQANGVRYAVWNLLCYSHISFSEAEEVFAAMQWGEDAQKGKLFEPSRCQLAFPVTGDNKTKYIAYIDVKERTVVYIDANLYGDVSSAERNCDKLSEVMPAYEEYLDTLPSVYDLFKGVDQSEDGVPVVYDDKDIKIEGGPAYVFKPLNESNRFDQLDLSKLLV